MSQQDIRELAGQGNPKAIASLLNRSLNPKGITAKVRLRGECLHVLLESEQVQNEYTLIMFIHKKMINLGVEGIINLVKVSGYHLGSKNPDWTQYIELKNPFLNFKVRSLVLGYIILFGVIGYRSDLNIDEPIVALFLGLLVYSLLYLWALERFRQLDINYQRLMGNLPSNYHWLPTVGLVVPVLLFSTGTFYLSHYLLSFFAPSLVESILNQKLFLSASETSAPILYNLFMIFVSVIVAPVTEEFFFRGIILHRWAAKWGMRSALIASSLLFGFLHNNFLGLSVFGLVMALLYLKTRTLIVSITCHALNNAAGTFLGLLPILSGSAETVYTVEQFRSDWWWGVLYVVLSAPWLIHFIYKNWPNPRSPAPYFVNASQFTNHFN